MLTEPATGASSSTIACFPGCRWRATASRARSQNRTRCSPVRGTRSSSTIPTPSAGSCTGTRPTSIRCTSSSSIRRSASRTRDTPKWLFGLEPEQARVGALRPGSSRQHDPPFMEGAWMTKHARAVLPPVRRAGHRVQRLRERRLRRRRSARPVHVRAVQSGRATSRADSCRAPGTATPSRTCTATGGTPARRGSPSTGTSSGASGCIPPGFDARRPDVRRHALRRFPALAADKGDGAIERRALHRLDAALVPEAGHGVVRARQLSREQRHGRESAHVLGRQRESRRASGSRSTSVARTI